MLAYNNIVWYDRGVIGKEQVKMENLNKLDKLKLFGIIVLVLVGCYLLLKLTYNDGVNKCTDYGYNETYCHNELIK
jgi:hypothetical protein